MTKIISFLFVFAFLVGCSAVPSNPKLSFGKKCAETDDGQIAYSYVWLFDKEAGLKANETTFKKIAE